jgi:hypothetical protein
MHLKSVQFYQHVKVPAQIGQSMENHLDVELHKQRHPGLRLWFADGLVWVDCARGKMPFGVPTANVMRVEPLSIEDVPAEIRKEVEDTATVPTGATESTPDALPAESPGPEAAEELEPEALETVDDEKSAAEEAAPVNAEIKVPGHSKKKGTKSRT